MAQEVFPASFALCIYLHSMFSSLQIAFVYHIINLVTKK